MLSDFTSYYFGSFTEKTNFSIWTILNVTSYCDDHNSTNGIPRNTWVMLGMPNHTQLKILVSDLSDITWALSIR